MVVSLVQIVPRLPPAVDGLGDYAFNLARQLDLDFGYPTHFVVGDSTWAGATQIEEFPISSVTERSATALLSLLPSDRNSVVLLHYVGYGYANRGCPVWLVEGLERWKANTPNSRLVTMFHEVYASGKLPWNSCFWLSAQQRNLAARLAQLSDRCLTSKQYYALVLCSLSQGKQTQILTLPVSSNIGEPELVPPLAERAQRLVVFGGRSKRLRVYQKSLKELKQACQLLGIEEILDIGPPTGLSLSSVDGVPVVEMGQLPAPEISDILLNSLAGFLNYNPEYLAKSGIFAAYCAHGLLPVSPKGSVPIDGIEPGKHYWVVNDRTSGLKGSLAAQAIADNAYTWYQTHNLSAQAQTFAAHISSNAAIKIGGKV